MNFPNPENISPKEFELLVKSWFEKNKGELKNFEAFHREKIAGADGEYEIDVVLNFKIFEGAEIKVLVECKKYMSPIAREKVQILKDKKESVGAHKAIIVSTSKFQSGAEEYAKKNGIALMQVVSGDIKYIQNSIWKEREIPKDADEYAGIIWVSGTNDFLLPMAVSTSESYALERWLESGT